MTTILLEPLEGGPQGLATTDRARSPRQIAWRRFRRDRVGMASAAVVVFFLVVASAAPLIARVYGKNPYSTYGLDRPGLLNEYSFPVGAHGGMSSEYWLGLEPGLGRDVFMQLVYGARTSLFIAFSVALITSVVGVLFGIVTGYLGGRVDAIGAWIIDVMLAFPGLLLLIALSLVVDDVFVGKDEEASTPLRFLTVIVLFSIFGWVFQARLIRGQVLSLREREFIDAARMSGAGTWRIVRRELLPNLWSPILITFSMAVPTVITGEAALSFLGVGIVEPIPDWGRMVNHGAQVYLADPAYLLIPGGALLVMVLAFNLLGDAVRDALDSKGLR